MALFYTTANTHDSNDEAINYINIRDQHLFAFPKLHAVNASKLTVLFTCISQLNFNCMRGMFEDEKVQQAWPPRPLCFLRPSYKVVYSLETIGFSKL